MPPRRSCTTGVTSSSAAALSALLIPNEVRPLRSSKRNCWTTVVGGLVVFSYSSTPSSSARPGSSHDCHHPSCQFLCVSISISVVVKCAWPLQEQYACSKEQTTSKVSCETETRSKINNSSVTRQRQHPNSPINKIMSLHHHHHHQPSSTSSQQQQPPTTTSVSTTTTTGQLRSSSTSPTHHHQHHQQQTRYFTQRQPLHHQHHHHHQQQFHFLPPRPPSTTSSGSVSTCGFPDDLPDDLPLPPPTPQEPTGTTTTSAGGPSSSTSGLYTFHPAHHSLLYHRHTSPHFPPQHHHIHHQHYSIPPPSSSHHHPPHHSSSSSHHPHRHGIQPSASEQLHLGTASGGGSSVGGSRAASRQTYTGGEEDDDDNLRGDEGATEDDNLLLVDNSVGVQDAVYLDPVTTDNFLTNVVQRFKRDFIYTYVGEGTLLVSVNPYKPLSIFSPRVKAAYRNISNPFQLPPHIYGQLCLILQRNTSSLERTQTLLLTGESGSGKSTNLSYLLDFLATKQEPHQNHHHHHQQPCRSRRNSGRSTGGGGGGAATSTKAGSYYLSTGSLHRHHHYSGGSGRASSLSLSAPSAAGGGVATTSSAYSLPNLALSLLQGNFLLNAFGNCKTPKNWDASRFGKLAQLQIDFLGNVCGGRIITYQLEKWRVQGPIGGIGDYERNFHIFYILLAGADSTTLKSLRLTRNLENYAMLNVKNHSSFLNASQTTTPSAPFCPHDHYYNMKGASSSTSSSGTSHYEGCFQLVKTTLSSLLPSTSQINSDHVFRMLAAILKLNNLVFAPVANIDGTEGCDVTNEQDLNDLGMLLQIMPGSIISGGHQTLSSPSTPNNGNNNNNHILGNNHHHPLKTILTTRRVSRTDGSIANIELTASESSSLRNALTVSLYNRLFSWLTKQINVKPPAPSSSGGGGGGTNGTSKHNLLNIVDFYGFEVFQTNSLEQFLINFTNEKIQFVLADMRLRMLQEEFVRDGLEWITIDTAVGGPASTGSTSATATTSSAPSGKLIDLVEENCHGLLSIFANCANDHELERQFSRRFSSREQEKENSSTSPCQKASPPPAPSTTSSNSNLLMEYLHQSFRLRHWAGPVVYSTRHFATKNRDNLPPHLPHQLYTWTADPLVRSLFSHDGRTPPSPMDISSTSSARLLATSNMELSLRNLFQKCSGGTSKPSHHRIYYIRCLKPNELSQPEVCESALLKHQVRYHRLIDFVRVYRDGFTYNLGAFEFLERYKLLSLNTWPNWRHPQEIRLGIQVLMKDLQMKEGLDWCFGGGSSSSGTLLHHHHHHLPSSSSGETLKVYLKGQRILSELEDFRRERLDDLALLIQKVWKGYRDWSRWNRMRHAHQIICRAWKGYLQFKRKEQRKLWKQMKHAVRLIQQRYILWKRRLFLRQLILQVRAELQAIHGAGGGAVGGGIGTLPLPPASGGMLSPISKDWPYPPSYLEEASYHLKRVFHRWRCRLYRSRFNEMERAKMAEKVTASLLFKDKKNSYSRSISHPFLGDYIRLRQNSQWRRTTVMMMLQAVTHSQQLPHVPSTASAAVAQALEEAARAAAQLEESADPSSALSGKKLLLPSQQLQIVFADLINKITRSSGKFLPIVLVVTTTQIMILDPRTLNIKYKIPAAEIWRLSMSPYGDDICVLHLQHPGRVGGTGGGLPGSVLGPGEQGNLFGGMLSDDDDAYYQFGDEPSPTGNFGAGGCVCSSGNTGGGGGGGSGFAGGGGYYTAGGGESPQGSQQQHQCQPGSGGCGLFGSGGDSDSGHYAVASEVVKLTKGDLVLHTCHLIEMITKIYLVVKNATGKGPEIVINNEFPAVFNNQRVQLCFRYSKTCPQPTSGSKSKGNQQHHDHHIPTAVAVTSGDSAESRAQLTRSPPPAPLVILPDGPCPIPPPPPPAVPQGNPSNNTNTANCSVPPLPTPLPPSTSKEEPVIPPSQIKITRKKSTRMEFLIGHS